jgi:hypothetical protein
LVSPWWSILKGKGGYRYSFIVQDLPLKNIGVVFQCKDKLLFLKWKFNH